jgi:RNA polymerase sigma-70 factor, ECF subfamily
MSGTAVTQFLRNWRTPNSACAGQVVASLYSELHRMAAQAFRSESPGHILQPTALISELYLRLSVCSPPVWRDRTHFFAVAATTLRRILVDHARARGAQRRGCQPLEIALDSVDPGVACSYDDVLVVDEALTQLETADPRAARVAELRFFVGLEEKEIAEYLGVSEITVKRDWRFARAWLATRLGSLDCAG